MYVLVLGFFFGSFYTRMNQREGFNVEEVTSIPHHHHHYDLSLDDQYQVNSCTNDQMDRIKEQLFPLGLNSPRSKIHFFTRCPSTPWLSKYFKDYFHTRTGNAETGGRKSFLGIVVGCNGVSMLLILLGWERAIQSMTK